MVPCCQQLSSSRVPLGGLRQVRVERDSSSLCEFLHSVCSPPLCLSLLHPFLGCFHRLRNQLSVSIYFWSLSHIYIYIFPPHHRHTDTQRHTDTLIPSLTVLHTLSPLYTIKDTHSHFSPYTSCTHSFTHAHSFTQFHSLKHTPLHTVSYITLWTPLLSQTHILSYKITFAPFFTTSQTYIPSQLSESRMYASPCPLFHRLIPTPPCSPVSSPTHISFPVHSPRHTII